MRIKIIKMGNERGIVLPKAVLTQTGISREAELTVLGGRIIIQPISNPRKGWDRAFAAMAQAGDDALLDPADGLSHSWDEKEWS